MLHFITRIVICSFGFRRVLPSHLFFYLGGSFFFVSAQTYITLTLLAILAHSTLQLLYDHVANGSIHVAMRLFRRNRTCNLNAAYFFQRRCKESFITAPEAP
ncbi:hypothetical protein PII47_13095 [Pseudomonas sp. 21TX0197]|uniref:hypothetical protein n=1 Tax=unclassified Pseudomonas TaxID=196821 RepID=UPI0012E966D6|nr:MULTISPECIES: hypothetical protein [unclassified Pseudomonas]MDB6444322.1 hypothetical protein [Pseudomonas sp. 21TX0197]